MADTPNPEMPVLVLQGGGALGAYQGGAYEQLAVNDFRPEWVAGVSIGAINAAIIAGNLPGNRRAKLRSFWEMVSATLASPAPDAESPLRPLFSDYAAMSALMFGIPGFFEPRRFPLLPFDDPPLSVYDTAPLRKTLLEHVDFDVLNHGDIRLSLGAVDVESGNSVYFDNRDIRIEPEHVMASGALPPGFPPVAIDGRLYWDGGLVSNTPLQYVLDVQDGARDLLVFQVDLFSASGPVPKTAREAAAREKDIRYSSRTRLNTDSVRELMELRQAAATLLSRLPPQLAGSKEAKALEQKACQEAITIVQLIHRPAPFESDVKDFEFSRASMLDHWAQGAADVAATFHHPAWQHRQRPVGAVMTFDAHRSHPARISR